ncbi:hypothetical protein, partial [Rhizobium leguminosarum]|uniref:hypothetical protein n=1 Tax=Rhizobium leguminosarum TaxID=384 RepID=UPI003F9AC365
MVVVAERLSRAIMENDALAGATVVIPEGRWHDVLTGRDIPGGVVQLTDLLDRFPCAVLEEISA